MRKFLRLLTLFALMSLYAADAAKAPRTDVWAELTYCGTDLEMFGFAHKFRLNLSENFPLDQAMLVVTCQEGNSGSEQKFPLRGMGDTLQFGYSPTYSVGDVRRFQYFIAKIAFGGKAGIKKAQLEHRDGSFPKIGISNHAVLFPGEKTAFAAWERKMPPEKGTADISTHFVFSPWEKPPRHGLFLQLVIPAEELAKVEAGTPYHVMLRNRTLERLGFPPDKVRDGWNLEELDRKVAELAEYRLRFDTGAAGLPEVLVREIAVLRALLGQPGVAASPQAKELCRAYETRLVKQLDLFKRMYEAGNIPLEALKSKEHELNEFRAKYAADAAQPTQTDAQLARYRAAAEKGDAAAQLELGLRLLYANEGKESLKYLRLAARQGHPTARGWCLLFGCDVKKDHKAAVECFRSEASKGEPWAQFLLGECYIWGHGVERNIEEGVRWFRKSALQGNAVAQFHLSERYQFGGVGVARNPAEAEKWIKKSAEQGFEPALRVLDAWKLGKRPPDIEIIKLETAR